MRRPWARLILHRRVVVNLAGGERAISGVLWDERGELLVLKDARAHGDGAPAEGTPIDGEAIIERARIEFVQALPIPAE